MNQLVKAVLVVAALMSGTGVIAQQDKTKQAGEVPKGWHLLDKTTDGFYGISVEKAYDFIKSKNLKGKTVVVAVIDSGIDTLHEDLKEVLWRNPGEIPGNGIDDDGNGYIDDVNGWNFLGGKDGKNVNVDSYEGARVYHGLKEKYANKTIDTSSMDEEELEEYKMWLRAKEKIEGDTGGGIDLSLMKRAYASMVKSDSILKVNLKKEIYTGNDIEKFEPATPSEKGARGTLLYFFKAQEQMEGTNKDMLEMFHDYLSGEERKAESREKAPPAYRAEIVQDDYNDINDKYYGNPDVMASTPMHGTHVAGIIGATRNNNLGMNGVADNVQIMVIRAVPDGDEHDKDVALGIRYAVDNGAKVINMSFGKDFSPQKKWVDEAVEYAASHGVLLVHAAGNDAKNIDSAYNFPNANLTTTKTKATNWITVGASGDPKAGGITASFSNYGKEEVDVFAPGVRIYSTLPGGTTYGNLQGTSMASPVVAGAAAFLFSYFPHLTPDQIKYAIESSATVPDIKVRRPGTDEMVSLSEISKNGGLLNLYEAAKVAASLSTDKKPDNKKAPKSTLKNKKG